MFSDLVVKAKEKFNKPVPKLGRSKELVLEPALHPRCGSTI
jgi:hypothetical protein